jgi:hypothetical protein
MSTNLYRRLLELIPSEPILVATLDALHSDGTATVVFLGGGQMRVRNPLGLAAGSSCYVQGGAVIGDAPALPFFELDIA